MEEEEEEEEEEYPNCSMLIYHHPERFATSLTTWQIVTS